MLKKLLRLSRHFNKAVSIFLSLYIFVGPVLTLSMSDVFAAVGDHPQVTVTSPSDNAYVNGTVNIRGTVDDPNDDLNFYHIGVYDADEDTWNFSLDDLIPDVTISNEVIDGTLYSWDTSTFADGKYLIRVAAVDDAGNKDPMTGSNNVEGESVTIIPVTVDHTMPTVDLTSHTEGEYLNGSETISGVVNDTNLWRYWFVVQDSGGHVVAGPNTVYNNGPVVNPSFVWDTTSVPNGDYQLILSARDKANNKQDPGVSTEIVNVHVFNIETPVNLGWNAKNSPADGYAEPRPVTELVCGDATNINAVSIHWSDVSEGNTLVKYVRQYKIGSGAWGGGEVYATPYSNFRVFGSAAGIENTYDSRVRAFLDLNGNNIVDAGEIVSDWSTDSCTITFDKTMASSTLATPIDGGMYNSPILISGTSLDLVGVSFVSLYYRNAADPADTTGWMHITDVTNSLENSPFNWNYSWDPADGLYDVKAVATDKAGNVENTAYAYEITYDTTAPSVDITTQSDGDHINGAVTVSGVVSDINLLRYWFVIENSIGGYVAGLGTVLNNGPVVNPTLVWDTTAVPDGLYTIKLEARDKAGNKLPNQSPVISDPEVAGDSVDWVTVTVDNSGPTIPTNLTPSEDSYHKLAPILNNWDDSSDDSGVLKYIVEYVYDDGHTFSGGPYRETFVSQRNHTPSPSEQGGVKFRVKAVDVLGNVGDWSEWRHYYYDSNAPVLTINSLVSDSVVSSINFDMTSDDKFDKVGLVTDNISVLYRKVGELIWIDADSGDNTFLVDPYNYVDTFIPSEDGVYEFKIVATDKAGNTTVQFVSNVTYDTNAPTLSDLEDETFNEGDTIPDYYVDAQDELSGVSEICYAVEFNGGFIGDDCESLSIPELSHTWYIRDILSNALGSSIDKFDTSVINEGIYGISYYVKDALDNQSGTKYVTYTLNNVIPAVVLGVNQTIDEDTSASFTGLFTDPSYIEDPMPSSLEKLISNFEGNTPDDSNWSVYMNYGEGQGYEFLGFMSQPNDITVPSNVYEDPGVYTANLKVCEVMNVVLVGAGVSLVESDYPYAEGEGECGTSENVIVTVNNVVEPTVVVNNPPVVPAAQPQVQGVTDENLDEEENVDEENDTDTTEDTSGDVLGALTCDSKQETSGYVYEDKNGNGKKDDGEKGIEGVKVEIKYTDSEGKTTTIETVETDEDGKWNTELCPAKYDVVIDEETVPDNYNMSDEDVLGIQVKEGEDLNNVDIALEKDSSIWGWVFGILALLLVLGTATYMYARNRRKAEEQYS